METKLTILGLSEAGISMIFDILESTSFFPKIDIINNLNIIATKEFINSKFQIRVLDKLLFDNKMFTLGVVKPNSRFRVRQSYKDIPSDLYINLISKQTSISSTVEMGFGITINAMSVIAAHTSLENFVYINRNCSVGHHTKVGEFTTLNPGVNIAGNVEIGKQTQIGIGTNVFDGIKIGNNVIIGGGSVVTRDIPDNVIAYGNPCKIIKDNG